MIQTLDQLVERASGRGRRFRIAVAWAQDPNTVGALERAVKEGFATAFMLGDPNAIRSACRINAVDASIFTIIPSDDASAASEEAVRMVKSGEADILMKGLVGTDVFLKAVMDRDKGLMLPGSVLTYAGAIELPAYHKLLFITDPAVIPFPSLDQKKAMAGYAVDMARKLGIQVPKIALISATEKMSRHFPSSNDYAGMKRLADEGYFGPCIMDGPVDIFLACDRQSVEIKGFNTPVGGEADILLFPSLEACNPFYKGLMLFAGGELAGLIRGTEKPVVLMSRSESGKSKFYCLALACLMA